MPRRYTLEEFPGLIRREGGLVPLFMQTKVSASEVPDELCAEVAEINRTRPRRTDMNAARKPPVQTGEVDSAANATLYGRITIAGRAKASDLNAPAFRYIKVADDGYGAMVIATGEPPLSTLSVANEVRALIEALPGYEFEGSLVRRTADRFGAGRSRIGVSGRTVTY